MPDELNLFPESLAVTAPLSPPGREWGAIRVTWKKVKQPARGGAILCADCIRRIHSKGVQNAPQPRRAVTTRVGPNDQLPLCHEDAQRHKDQDTKVEREYRAHMAWLAEQERARKADGD